MTVRTFDMRARVLTLAFALAALSPDRAASAEPFHWTFSAESRSLIGMEQVEEGDYAFHAVCSAAGAVKLGIGAASGVGKGEGERVSVTLSTAHLSARIDGTSGNSANFEMTAGVELQATVQLTHPVFQILLDPGPIKATGALRQSWPDQGRAAAARKFLAACRK